MAPVEVGTKFEQMLLRDGAGELQEAVGTGAWH